MWEQKRALFLPVAAGVYTDFSCEGHKESQGVYILEDQPIKLYFPVA